MMSSSRSSYVRKDARLFRFVPCPRTARCNVHSMWKCVTALFILNWGHQPHFRQSVFGRGRASEIQRRLLENEGLARSTCSSRLLVQLILLRGAEPLFARP